MKGGGFCSSVLKRLRSADALLAVALGLPAAALLGGCATDRQKTVGQGAGIGAVVGAVVGGVVGGREGAAAGAVIGGAGGAVYGSQVADRKQAYADTESKLNLAVQEGRRQIAAAQFDIERANGTIAQLKQTQRRLQGEVMSAQARQQVVRDGQRLAQTTGQSLDKRIHDLRAEIQRSEQLLALEQQRAKSEGVTPVADSAQPSAIQTVSANIREMSALERTLLRSRAELQQIDLRRAY